MIHLILQVISYWKIQSEIGKALGRVQQPPASSFPTQLLRNSRVYYQYGLKANEETIFL